MQKEWTKFGMITNMVMTNMGQPRRLLRLHKCISRFVSDS